MWEKLHLGKTTHYIVLCVKKNEYLDHDDENSKVKKIVVSVDNNSIKQHQAVIF